MTVLIFLLVLAVLIFVHELGHFLTARACGIRVDAFKIGFGPRIIHWKRGETEYGINLIPFGGYVKIHGENPDEESTSGSDSHRSFVNKPKYQQVLVLAAGVLFNFIFAWILYSGSFMTGVTATLDGFQKYADRFENKRVMVTYVTPASPAEMSGIMVGDVLKNASISEMQSKIDATMGIEATIQIERDEQLMDVSVIPEKGLVDDRYAIGIAMQEVGDLKLSFFRSIGEGLNYTVVMMKETTKGLYTFFSNIFKGQANFADVAGPIGIAGIIGDAADLGFTYLVMITAIISINLGIINLIPFPALDGGRILFVLVEGITRRRIPMKFANVANMIGFFLLMLLMIVVTYKDIVKIVTN